MITNYSISVVKSLWFKKDSISRVWSDVNIFLFTIWSCRGVTTFWWENKNVKCEKIRKKKECEKKSVNVYIS